MGTRHLTLVVLDDKIKVAQYGQWDGYPAGQGEVVAEFIKKKMNKQAFRDAVSECKFLTEKEIKEYNDTKREMTDEFSRDTGAKILEMIQNKNIRLLYSDELFAADSLMCEWAWLLDLDREILEVYKGFNQKKAAGRFADMKVEPECNYTPITLVREYPFKIVNKALMGKLEKELQEKEEE